MSEEEMPEELAGQPVISFATLPDCEAWFAEHHADHRGFWLKIGKVGAAQTFNYAEALEVALGHGWIDGQKRGCDDESYWLQRFTPRGPRSRWSQINRDKAVALINAGRMRPAGQAQVDAAKADGRWEAAYAGQKSATVPDDLAAALGADLRAKAFFETLRGANRYAILYRVHDAKKPETRAAYRDVRRDVPQPRDHPLTAGQLRRCPAKAKVRPLLLSEVVLATFDSRRKNAPRDRTGTG